MRISKEVREALDRIVADRPEITREEVAFELKKLSVMPDMDKLINKEFNGAASRFLASYRDKNGSRQFLSARSRNRFVNVDITESQEDLDIILDNLTKQFKGIGKEIRKVKRRGMVLTGQISIDAWYEEIGRNRHAR